jgi:hypothetical protein
VCKDQGFARGRATAALQAAGSRSSACPIRPQTAPTTVTLARGGPFGTPGSIYVKETMPEIQAMIDEIADV